MQCMQFLNLLAQTKHPQVDILLKYSTMRKWMFVVQRKCTGDFNES